MSDQYGVSQHPDGWVIVFNPKAPGDLGIGLLGWYSGVFRLGPGPVQPYVELFDVSPYERRIITRHPDFQPYRRSCSWSRYVKGDYSAARGVVILKDFEAAQRVHELLLSLPVRKVRILLASERLCNGRAPLLVRQLLRGRNWAVTGRPALSTKLILSVEEMPRNQEAALRLAV